MAPVEDTTALEKRRSPKSGIRTLFFRVCDIAVTLRVDSSARG